MKQPVKWGVAGLLVLALAGLAVRARQPEVPSVPVAPVAAGRVESTVSNTRAGTIRACQRSRLSMPIGGRVEVLHVKEGDRVAAGQALLALWNKDLQATVAQAEASLAAGEHERNRACLTAGQNEREHQRARSLLEKKLISPTQAEAASTLATTSRQACEAAEQQAQMGRANLDYARARLELTTLHAPYAGVIAEVNSELGEYVTPSPPGVLTSPAIEIIDDSCLYVTAPIDEVDAMPVRTGMPARITLDAFRGRAFAGHVTRVAPYVVEVEKQARTVDVDVRFDDFPRDVPLLVGYSADIEIILEARENVLRVPSEAIVENRYLYVLGEDDRLSRREFTPGLANWTSTEVLGGLQAGERIVLSPDRPGVKEGARVKPEAASTDKGP